MYASAATLRKRYLQIFRARRDNWQRHGVPHFSEKKCLYVQNESWVSSGTIRCIKENAGLDSLFMEILNVDVL